MGAALRFLFNVMAPKSDPEIPFQGRPAMLYMDSGAISKSLLSIPAQSGQRPIARPRARSNGPFAASRRGTRPYHLHAPETEIEANA